MDDKRLARWKSDSWARVEEERNLGRGREKKIVVVWGDVDGGDGGVVD